MKQYGFLVAERASRWQVAFPDRDGAEEFPAKGAAEAARSKWRQEENAKKDAELEKAVEASERARKAFRAETKLEVVTVHNPRPFQVDYRKPTLTFPDGSELQFEVGTPTELIEDQLDAKALEAHPVPTSEDEAFAIADLEIEEVPIWEVEMVLAGERQQLPDIRTWDRYFPMESVAATLDALAEAGWSVAGVSEDRGLYSSDIASNRSAPVLVRYLLVRERQA